MYSHSELKVQIFVSQKLSKKNGSTPLTEVKVKKSPGSKISLSDTYIFLPIMKQNVCQATKRF